MATPRLLSDELASRRGRTPAKVTVPPPAVPHSFVPSGVVSDMVRLGPGQIGTSGAFEFIAPACGIVRLRILGAGNVVNLQFQENGATYALNTGVALASGSFFEFEFAVDGAEMLFVSGTSLAQVTCFWRPY